jgi:TolB protein
MIHALSYDINSKLGFEPIPWIKRKIVYSVNMAPKESAIFISDITLTYRKKIVSGGFNIFPKWFVPIEQSDWVGVVSRDD